MAVQTNRNTKARRTSYEVIGECEEFHCDSLDADSCPHLGSMLDRPNVQTVFERFGPSDERNCDWFRSTVEPWFSLSVALGYIR